MQPMASDVEDLENLASSGAGTAGAGAGSMPANWDGMNQEEKLGTILEMMVEQEIENKNKNNNAGGINSIDELIRLFK